MDRAKALEALDKIQISAERGVGGYDDYEIVKRYITQTAFLILTDAKDELLPCPFCGEQPELWDGRGIQADLTCGGCGYASVGIQVIDVLSYEERYNPENDFIERTLSYPQNVIDRVNKALFVAWNYRTPLLARPAKTTGAIPDGWVLAPIKPTEEMYKNLHTTPISVVKGMTSYLGKTAIDAIYKAVIAAAPQPPSEEIGNTQLTKKENVSYVSKAIDRMLSLVPDEISVIGTLVGLRDFADRPDYCPKVMKSKLSECIDNLQKLYHEQPIEGLSDALSRADLWQPMSNQVLADYNLYIEAARRELKRGG